MKTLRIILCSLVAAALLAGCAHGAATQQPADPSAESPGDDTVPSDGPELGDADASQSDESDQRDDAEVSETPRPDGQDTEVREVTFEIPERRWTGSETHGVRISAAESARLPLYEQPDDHSGVVDHIELQQGDTVQRRRDSDQTTTMVFVDARVELQPARITMELAESGPDHPRQPGEEADTVEIDRGEPVAILDVKLGVGFFAYYVWHDGDTYIVPGGFHPFYEEFTSEYTRRDMQVYNPIRTEYDSAPADADHIIDDEWWIYVEEADQSGWLLAVDGVGRTSALRAKARSLPRRASREMLGSRGFPALCSEIRRRIAA